MNIGIVGPPERAMAWENHLRSHQTVSEVTIVSKLKNIGSVDACFLLDDSKNRLHHLLEAVKMGLNTFLIGPLPTDQSLVEKTYYASEEANVRLQFSHWPTLAPASKWMSKKINRPSFIQIIREVRHAQSVESDLAFDYLWKDELAFCLRWIDGAVHHIDLNTVDLSGDKTYAIHLLLRFDSGATANIYVTTASLTATHQRIAADHNFIANCNVLGQKVRLGEQNSTNHLYFNKQAFDPSKSAELAAMEFIKSIQMKRPTIYNGYHLMELTKTLDKIDKRLSRI